MPVDLAALVHVVVAGLFLGVMLGGTPLLPRRGEAAMFWTLFALSLAYGVLRDDLGPTALARRTTYDAFAAAFALGGYLRRIVVAYRRRRALGAALLPRRSQ